MVAKEKLLDTDKEACFKDNNHKEFKTGKNNNFLL
jgi:hypothetical protein